MEKLINKLCRVLIISFSTYMSKASSVIDCSCSLHSHAILKAFSPYLEIEKLFRFFLPSASTH